MVKVGLQLIDLQAKEKKAKTEEEKEVKGREVRKEDEGGFERTGNKNRASERYHIPHKVIAYQDS